MFRYPRYVIKAARSWSRRARSASTGRGPRVRRAARPTTPTIEDYPAPAVPAVLHDVVRELSGRDGAHRAPGVPPLRTRMTVVEPRSTGRSTRTAMITLTLKEQPTVPLEAEVLSPDVIAPISATTPSARLPVFLGKRQCRLDDFFEVEGAGSDELEIRGDVGQGQVDRPRHDARPHHHRRQRRHAPRRLHEGRRDRGDRQRLGLGRRRDDRRPDPRPRQRRRPGRRGLSRQPRGDERAGRSSSRARPASKSACA